MDDRQINLIKNTVVLAAGSFSSKLIVFFLVPLYTIYLTPSNYGQFDIYITVLSSLNIIFSFQSVESCFRFIQDCKTDSEKTEVVSNALAIALFGIIVYVFGMIVVGRLLNFQYIFVFIVYVGTNILYNLFMQTLRGMNKMSIYATIGVFSTLVQIICNILFIIILGMGAISLLWAPVIAYASSVILLVAVTKMARYLSFKALKMDSIKDQYKYALPLIPNAILVWLMASLGRFILLFYFGTSEVGLLAFVLKFPMAISILVSIFFMALQVNLITEFSSPDKNEYASNIFRHFNKVMFSTMLIILPTIKIIIFTIIGKSYIQAWVYVPIFFYGVVFNFYALFFNIGFYGAKKTNVIFFSVLISVSVYFVTGMALTKLFHLYGIGIAYTLSEIIRWFIIKKYVKPYLDINIYLKEQVGYFAMLTSVVSIYYIGDLWIQTGMIIVGIAVSCYLNKKIITNFSKILATSKVK